MCNKIKVIVDDLKKEHADGEVTFITEKIDAPVAKKDIEAAGLELHGIVAKDSEGKIVKAIEGHSYGKDKVQEVVALLTKE